MSNETKAPMNLKALEHVTVDIRVEIGRRRLSIKEVTELSEGGVIELSKLAGEEMDVYVNETLIAKGECVVVNECFGVRIVKILGQEAA